MPTRVKDAGSFLEKVKRKDSKEPFKDIRDIVGIRVVCLFLSDIPRVGGVIRNSFLVNSEDNKIEGADVSSFGYLSFHFDAQMKGEYKGPRYDNIAGMAFEIQVRTILMDAWANVSHYLDYKSDTDVPRALRRDFHALSGLFYIADNHFELFFKSSKESSEQMAEVASEGSQAITQEEINLDSLSAYLRTRFPHRGHSGPKGISELIMQLNKAGYRTIKQIDVLLNATEKAFAAYEGDSPPRESGAFMDIGVVRISACIADDKFRAIAHPGNSGTSQEKYIKLVKATNKT
jgi:putative GTP pyrophosphokinase